VLEGNNTIGIAGINWDVKLVSLNISNELDDLSMTVRSSIQAIHYATNLWTQNERISILNFSVFGYGQDWMPIYAAVGNFLGLFIWSAGNFYDDVDEYEYIEDFQLDNLISVGAIDSNDNLFYITQYIGSNYSSTGQYVDIFAPGVSILSTWPYSESPYEAYSLESGTSMAAPHVTGVAALLLSVNPNLTAQQLKGIILDNSSEITITLPSPPNPPNTTVVVKKLDAFSAVTNQANIITHQTDLTSFYMQLGVADVYNWVCFPVLNKFNPLQQQQAGGIDFYVDDLYYNLHIYNQNELFATNPTVLKTMKWRYNADIDSVTVSNIGTVNHRLDSRYGYKIQLTDPHSISVILEGFLAESVGNLDTRITINARSPREPYRETWFGYYSTRSVEPLLALSSIEQYLIEIKTHEWAINRATVNDQWPSIASYRRLNFGEAVSLKYIDTNDRTFSLGRSRDMVSDDESTKYIHPKPFFFSYTEKEDYIPLYLVLNEITIGDNLGEIALFIDDVCYGAEVITGEELIQIKAYIADINLDTEDIELRLIEYDSDRGISGAWDPNVSKRLSIKNITSDTNKTFYSVSLKEDDIVEYTLPSLITLLERNYPNPFNPSTTIKYGLAHGDNVKLQVFNIKGQLVRTLVNTYQTPGSYSIVWNGDDSIGNSVSSGVYFYRLETKTYRLVKRMLLMK